MLRNTCQRCRLSQPEGLSAWIRMSSRHRSSNAPLKDLEPFSDRQRNPRHVNDLLPFGQRVKRNDDFVPFGQREHRHPVAHPHPNHYSKSRRPPPPREKINKPFNHSHVPPIISEENIIPYFESQVTQWASTPHTHDRLVSFGIPSGDSQRLLDAFADAVKNGSLSDPASLSYYRLQRFAHPHDKESIDVIYSTVLFSWASRPEHRQMLEKDVRLDPGTLLNIDRLVEATDRTYPAEEFPDARSIHRKIIMHVGPTNSGKTHHALRALAAANSGVYAGPLRLLAHEIWERLNTGQIVPLGVEEEPRSSSAPASRLGNPKYARPCNMITGEEQKLVGVDVPLLSCTVEMLSFKARHDVAVIDEIQMIADPDRGSGWTNAVLGVCAEELHLCGEETAVPVVQELLKHTGDEVIVRRYERLTPLVVEEESLNSDLTKVRKGDCIVTFSRSSIFALKKQVEDQTGMRCAVVYGRLPPEVRSEQAALFNDPDSGYDVIIGSDAIGMGLNLKIKRVIFEATAKYDGAGLTRPLSVSSVKQIAGRAGRYGLHESQADLGGHTTTLHPTDLPYLAKCISEPYESLPYARVGFNDNTVSVVSSLLPPNTPMETVLAAPMYIGRLPLFVRYSSKNHLSFACAYLDAMWKDMSNQDRVVLLFAPIPWRDFDTTNVIKRMLNMQKKAMSVSITTAIKGTGYMSTLLLMEDLMKGNAKQTQDYTPSTVSTLLMLESFHKVIVFYVWMSFRNPVVYAAYDSVISLKERLEVVLNWCLQSLSKKLLRQNARDKSGRIHPTSELRIKVAHKTKAQLRKEELISLYGQSLG